MPLLMIYWIPAYLYLIIWSIRIRRKHQLTEMNKMGESLIYACTCFMGIFIVFLLKPKHVKNCELP